MILKRYIYKLNYSPSVLKLLRLDKSQGTNATAKETQTFLDKQLRLVTQQTKIQTQKKNVKEKLFVQRI